MARHIPTPKQIRFKIEDFLAENGERGNNEPNVRIRNI